MPIAPALAHYLEAPDTLVGTAWVHYGAMSDEDGTGESQYVEATAVINGRALVVCIHDYHRPARTWWVPIESLLDEMSSFHLIGAASSLAWVQEGSWVVTLTETRPEYQGAWRIDTVGSEFVRMDLRRVPGTLGFPMTCHWLNMLRRFRAATEEEALRSRVVGGHLFDRPSLEIEQPAVQLGVVEPSVPEEPKAPEPPAANMWERLMEEPHV